MTGAKGFSSAMRSEISVTEALTSLRSRKPASLYVFAPGDDYFIPQAREAARSQVAEAFRAFDYAEYEGREDNLDGIREFLGSESFGSGHKVLVIDNLEDKMAKRLGTLAALLPSAAAITVLFADPAKVPDELLKKARVVTNYSVPPAAVRSWIRKRLEGRQIEDQAVHELMERTANSFFLMRSEIDKLLAFTDAAITVADVREVVPRSHAAAAADLVEAVSLRKFDRAARALEDLAASGASDTTVLYDVELGFMRLLNAKLVSRSNRPKGDLRSWCLRAQHQYLDDYTLTALLSAAGSVKLREIEGLLERLEEIEYDTKKGLTSSALVALEQLLSATALKTQ
jgi:DNA polymerase III delta subunit